MANVVMKDIYKSYGSTEVIHGLNLEIRSGEFTVLLGPSGCGKSTLLRMIAGLEEITDGDMFIDNEFVNETQASRRGCAMVFQNYALYPHQTVERNIGFPLRMAGTPRDEIDRRVREIADKLDLSPLLHRLPRDLSGGQRQRVAMGRAMIRHPRVYLFDEPLSNLDAELRVKMRLEIARLQRDLGATTVFVTHDQVEAMTLADRIVIMRSGVIEQAGAPLEVYRNPANLFVAGFIGTPAMNFVKLDESAPVGAGTKLQLGQGAEIVVDKLANAPAVTLGVRAEHLRLTAEAGPSGIEVSGLMLLGTEHLGDRHYAYYATSIGPLTVVSDHDEPFTGDDGRGFLHLDASQVHLFGEDERAVTEAAH